MEKITRGCLHDPQDEILEALWILDERAEPATIDELLSSYARHGFSEEHVKETVEEGLVAEDEGVYRLTESGRKQARNIIRRHRLAERLFVDILDAKEEEFIESGACSFEHFLSPEVTDHICILLGHPRKCPHGKDIPMGKCCERAQSRVESAVVPLSELAPGEKGRVLYMTTSQHQRLDRLGSMGLLPGKQVKVHQREPLFVIFLGETQIAIEKDIARDIFVMRA